jgi:hypothetical protein
LVAIFPFGRASHCFWHPNAASVPATPSVGSTDPAIQTTLIGLIAKGFRHADELKPGKDPWITRRHLEPDSAPCQRAGLLALSRPPRN